MEQQFEAVLTGTDSPIDGIVTPVGYDGFEQAYRFVSVDNTLHLIIAKDNHGNWMRIAGTEPYLSGWVDELTDQLNQFTANS
jgi:hypothetical protein